jgi:DNA (cytosine-5)-methyltransferase 1
VEGGTVRIGSLFSGAGGLDLAAEAVFGGKVVWQSEIDKAASKVLAHRFPDVPNLGDIKGVEWVDVPAVDVLCGGFPCQDVSAAGKRAGIKDGTRSGLWAIFAEAIDQLRPRFVVIENVRGLLSATAHRAVEDDESGDMESVAAVVGNGAGRPVLRAAGAVLGDLATLGYDAQWTTLAAAAVGAPHRRERVFVLAADTKHSSPGGRWPRCGEAIRVWQTGGAVRHSANASNAPGDGRDEGRPESAGVVGGFDAAVSGDGHVDLLPTPTTQDGSNNGGPSQFQRNTLPLNAEVTLLPTPEAKNSHAGPDYARMNREGSGGHDLVTALTLLCTPSAADGAGGHLNRSGDRQHEQLLPGQAREMATAWGKYAPAIARWESLTRPAPAPTEPNRAGNPRMSSAFSEWLMGWPEGWATDPAIGISRNDQLRIVGNGVVSRCAEAAIRYLLAVAGDWLQPSEERMTAEEIAARDTYVERAYHAQRSSR